MRERIETWVRPVAIGAAVLVAVATVVEAVRQDSWGPIWAVAWLPAVLVAAFYRPGAKGC